MADRGVGTWTVYGADGCEEAVMESRAKAFGHAIHPMLIVFPLGLLVTAVVFDVIYLINDRSTFAVAAAYMVAAGGLGGLGAAGFGLGDWPAIPAGGRAKRDWLG